jgi:hypothetical protein
MPHDAASTSVHRLREERIVRAKSILDGLTSISGRQRTLTELLRMTTALMLMRAYCVFLGN